jgi:hypothetical protein
MTTKINSDRPTSTTLHKVTNGLYAIRIEMREGMRDRATGLIVLCDRRIMGGDSFFTYTFRNGKWRGELITHQHTEVAGVNLAFGGREVVAATRQWLREATHMLRDLNKRPG